MNLGAVLIKTTELKEFLLCCWQGVYKQVPLDGIWLDMNEVSNYCSGDVCVDPGGNITLPCSGIK